VKTITLVTGSDHKLQEWRRLFPGSLKLESHKLDLTEIQSLDSKLIVEAKVTAAYEILRRPVLVEDVTAGLDALQGLPGPFIKFFEEKLGKDALYRLAGEAAAAKVSCTIGYFDGTKLLFGYGEIHGTAVASRGTNGFGFDTVFQPAGQTKTFAEMDATEKDAISHRHLAIEDLLKQL
jgi:non-canonical purine NTP pyrophosphatase (RdgB/HAM1 family)